MKRRDFLKSLGALAALPVLSTATTAAGAPLKSVDMDWLSKGQLFLDEVLDNMTMYDESHGIIYCGHNAQRALQELAGRKCLPHRVLGYEDFSSLQHDHNADGTLLSDCDWRSRMWLEDDRIPQAWKNPLQFSRYGRTVQFAQHPYINQMLHVNELRGIPAEMFDELPEAITGLKCGDDWMLGWRFPMQREEALRAHWINVERTVLFGSA